MANNSSTRIPPKEILGLNRITKKRLLELCKKDKLYQTPSLNDVLYLHYQGFQCIESLEDYTELKCLWLECNAISEIQGLENQTKLKCLFLQSNLIKKIENLECCKELDTINLSQNHIRKIENLGIDVLPVLNTLNMSSNYLQDSEGLRELENCKNVSVLDLSNNRIDDILVVKIFAKMPELKVLILQGNPVVSKIPQYRKTLILECKNLTYLDSRPVFPKDRACSEAWKRGGYEEERKENARWNHKERKKMRDSVNATIRMRNKFRKPEDHLTLLVSSDSEDESSKTKRSRQQQELDAGVDMELGIWEEVEVNDSKSETTSSSDMNVSSSTSVISTTDSNGEHSMSSNSHYNDESQNINAEGEILNAVTKASVSAESETKGNIFKFINQSHNEEEPEQQDIDKNKDETQEKRGGVGELDAKEEVAQSLVNNISKLHEKSLLEDTAFGSFKNVHEDTDVVREDENQDVENTSVGAKTQDDDNLEYNRYELLEKSSIENTASYELDLKNSHEDTANARNKMQTTGNDHNRQETSEHDEIPNDSNKDTLTAICRVTNNAFPQNDPVSERRVHLKIETNDDIYEPLSEMDEVMNSMVKQDDMDSEKARELNIKEYEKLPLPKTPSQIEYEMECSLVTNQMKQDFEQMSSNMDVFMVQLQKDKEKRKEALAALFTEKLANTEITSGSSGSEADMDADECRLHQLVHQWDIDTRLKGDSGKGLVGTSKGELGNLRGDCETNVVKHDVFSHGKQVEDDIPETDKIEKYLKAPKAMQRFSKPHEESVTTSICDNNLQEKLESEIVVVTQENVKENMEVVAFESQQKEKIKSSTECEINEPHNRNEQVNVGENCGEKSITPNISRIPEQSLPLEEEKLIETINAKRSACVRNEDFEYEPLDISLLTRASNLALNSFEKEAKELKDLLQKLENENDHIFKEFTAESKCEAEESAKEHIDKDIIENEAMEVNYKETQIEGPRNEVSPEDKEEICGQTLKDIIEALELKAIKAESYDFIDIETEEEEEKISLDDTKLPLSYTIRGVIDSINDIFKNEKFSKFRPIQRQCHVATTSSEKSASLKNLAAQPNLKMFNNDIHQSLDNLLSEYQKEQSLEIQQMVDRVYAQKDRYNDTIELIDGKLMVVDKDTGELKEFPRPPHYSSDSDVDYDTAQSDDEVPRSIKVRLPYKPIERRSAEQLVHQALKGHCQRSYLEDEDSDNDEFYSLDPLVKPSLYGNIDHEFFHKLSFDHLEFGQQDEAHVVQCARSYEELKNVLTLSEEERFLTEEEKQLLEKMIERKTPKKREEEPQYNDDNNTVNVEATEYEDALLKKMMRKSKERKLMKSENQPLTSDVEIQRMPFRQPNGPIKIFEYKFETSGDPYYCPRTWQQDIDIDVTVKVMDNETTEVYGNDVYNFIHDDSGENNQDLEKTLRLEDLNRIECQEELNNMGDDNGPESLMFLDKFSEEEKNEIENNTDVEGNIIKKEIKLENDLKEEIKVNETVDKEYVNLRYEDIVKDLPDKEKGDGNVIFRRDDQTMSTITDCEKSPEIVIPTRNNNLETTIMSLNNGDMESSKNNENSEDMWQKCNDSSKLLTLDCVENDAQNSAINLHFLKSAQATLTQRHNCRINGEDGKFQKLLAPSPQKVELLPHCNLQREYFQTLSKYPRDGETLWDIQLQTYPSAELLNAEEFRSPDLENSERVLGKKSSVEDSQNFTENALHFYSTQVAEGNIRENNSQMLFIDEGLQGENFSSSTSVLQNTEKRTCQNSNNFGNPTMAAMIKPDGGGNQPEYNSQIVTTSADDHQLQDRELFPLPKLLESKNFPSILQTGPDQNSLEGKLFPVNVLNSIAPDTEDHIENNAGESSKGKPTEATKDEASNISNNSGTQSQRADLHDGKAFNPLTIPSISKMPDTEPFRTPPEVDILECNLDIFDNEDVIDTITVNAEIHYDF